MKAKSTLPEHARRALEYIKVSGGPTVQQFDEDHEPIGPLLRKELSPTYIELNLETRKLQLTAKGLKEL